MKFFVVMLGAASLFGASHFSAFAAPCEDVGFGNFSIVFLDYWNDGAGSGSTMALRYKDTPLSGMEQSVRWADYETFAHNDCRTMRAFFFSGGASCCYGNYLLTSCVNGDYAVAVNTNRNETRKAPSTLANKGAFYVISDTEFVGYSRKAASGDTALSFSVAESPIMDRLLVFDGKFWKADSPGAFSEFYAGCFSALSRNIPGSETEQAGRAMALTYYAYLAENDETRARSVFTEFFPHALNGVADVVFADVLSAAKGTVASSLAPLVLPRPGSMPAAVAGSAAAPAAADKLPARPGKAVGDSADAAHKGGAAAEYFEHAVRRGETLYSLSRQYGVTPGAVLAANPQLGGSNIIKVGNVLRVPKPAGTTQDNTGPPVARQ